MPSSLSPAATMCTRLLPSLKQTVGQETESGMKRSTYLELIRHAQKCLDCMRWLLQTDGGETLCAHGRHILSHESFNPQPKPIPVLAGMEPEDEQLRRTR